MAKTNLEKAKRNKRFAGVTAVLSTIASAIGGSLHLQHQYKQVESDLYGNPDNIGAMRELFQDNGCSNFAEWQQKIADHTITITKNVFENGMLVKKNVSYGDAVAVEMTNKYNELCAAIANAPADYMTVDPFIMGLVVAVPVVTILAYAIYRHKYKKLLKAQKTQEEALPEQN